MTERRVALLRRRAELLESEFTEYWHSRHGPFLLAQPDYLRHRSEYAQTHVLRPLWSTDEPWDGIADRLGGRPNRRSFLALLASPKLIASTSPPA
ncbi:EthD domain-containing protein [Cryobacterium sp. TMS1-20-1]|uniref:EthD domain-containing protein n=1 Tax=Cryobacterium sp. TMS1-20-1 TaxID=1259223 RepID=UPI00141B73DA|nr:EthD domain-containing protein [Cryobacterium sp. TMS1-20-1]